MTTKLLQACLADQMIKCFYTLSACVYPEELQSDKMLMFPSAKATCGSSPLWKHRVCIVLKNSTLNFLYSDSLHELMFVLPGSMMSLALVGHKTTAARRRLPRCCEKPGDEVTVTRRQNIKFEIWVHAIKINYILTQTLLWWVIAILESSFVRIFSELGRLCGILARGEYPYLGWLFD